MSRFRATLAVREIGSYERLSPSWNGLGNRNPGSRRVSIILHTLGEGELSTRKGLPSFPGEKALDFGIQLAARISADHWKNSVISGAVAAAPGKVFTPSPFSMSRKVL